jgi:chromosome segregation ATPase
MFASASTAATSLSAFVPAEIQAVRKSIDTTEGEINSIARKIELAEKRLNTRLHPQQRKDVRSELEHYRTEKDHLRAKEGQLRTKENILLQNLGKFLFPPASVVK